MDASADDAGRRARDDETVKFLLTTYRRLVVVGASATQGKPAHDVPLRMRRRGYEVVPVNPTLDSWEGVPAAPDLQKVSSPEIVDVFRRAEEAPKVAQEAVNAGAKAVWLQQGIRSDEARRIVEDAGVHYIEDRCVNLEYQRLRSQGVLFPHLTPGPDAD